MPRMTSLTPSRLAGAVTLCAGLALASPAGAATAVRGLSEYDGTWSVEVVTERGECDRAYRYGIVIEGGQVRYAGGTDFTINGRVEPGGAVKGSIVRGSDRADVVGRLADRGGNGTWMTVGARSCGGRWNAERRG